MIATRLNDVRWTAFSTDADAMRTTRWCM